MKELSILGSTGSIGTQTIDVIQKMSDKFSVKYLSTYQNIELIIKQAKILNPSAICIVDSTKLEKQKENFYPVAKEEEQKLLELWHLIQNK